MNKIAHDPNPAATFFAKQGARASKHAEAAYGRSISHLPPVIRDVLGKPVSFYRESPGDITSTAGPLTHIGFVLDCSGSMQHGKQATINGFNEQLRVVQAGAAVVGGNTRFTEVYFNDVVQPRQVAGPIDQVALLTDATYQPDGYTALFDALGQTVAALLLTPDIWAPKTATLVTVFTDGEENASQLYSAAVLKDLIERLEATDRWTFALVGPNETVGGLAELLAVKEKNVAGYDVSSIEDKELAFQRVRDAKMKFMAKRAVGETMADDLYE